MNGRTMCMSMMLIVKCKGRRQRSSGGVMGKERGETIPISWFWVEMEETVLSFRTMS
jgi:hypothetical protein